MEVLANTASWTGQCYSVALGLAYTPYAVIGFTTYDGSSGWPLHNTNGNTYVISNELKPTAPGAATNLTDYIASSDGTIWGIYEYGYARIILPTTDTDGDGFPDVIQLNKPGNAAFTGTAQSDWTLSGTPVTYTLSGNLYRAAGSDTGTYSLTLVGGPIPLPMAGSVHLSHWYGTVTYSRGSSNLTIAGTLIQQDGSTRTLTGTTSYVINSTNQITVAGCVLTDNLSRTYSLNSVALHRDGVRYRGNANLVDGNRDTTWGDYRDWRIEVVDTNDENGNGIPDLSDPSAIICLTGDLAFGKVVVSNTAQRTFTIANTGNATLTVTGISYPTGFSGPFSGDVPPGGVTNVVVTFAPVAATNYAGVLTVSCNATLGTNSLPVSGVGIAPFDAWIAAHFSESEQTNPSISGLLADPDHDGMPNLMEYAFASDPKVGSADDLPKHAIQNDYLTLTYRKNKQATDISYFVEACATLVTNSWSTNGLAVLSTVDCDTYWLVTVRDSVPMGSATNRFMRLRVTKP